MVELAWRERERGLEGMEIRRELGEGKAGGKRGGKIGGEKGKTGKEGGFSGGEGDREEWLERDWRRWRTRESEIGREGGWQIVLIRFNGRIL